MIEEEKQSDPSVVDELELDPQLRRSTISTSDDELDETLDASDRISEPSMEAFEQDKDDQHLEDVLEEDASDEQDEALPVEPIDESEQDDHEDITLSSVIEAVLFSADQPVTPGKLVEIMGTGSVKDVREMIEQLNQKYEEVQCAFRIESIAGGYQMLTMSKYNVWLKKLIKVRSETKLSPAALETLAIISYKQPILRVDIENIRGVAAGEMVRQLIEKGLVKIVGRAEELGRPMLYGTTKKFLEVFGLHSLKDLPSAEDLKPLN